MQPTKARIQKNQRISVTSEPATQPERQPAQHSGSPGHPRRPAPQPALRRGGDQHFNSQHNASHEHRRVHRSAASNATRRRPCATRGSP
eukprot:5726868-Prymnesium_polylepis.1